MIGQRRARYAARVLVIDPDDQLLMFRFTPDDRPPLWATAGGELAPGEDFIDGARRELLEETGIDADPGEPIAERESDFVTFAGEPVHAVEQYFAVRVATRALDFSGHTDQERCAMKHYDWWPVDRVDIVSEDVFPRDLKSIFELSLARLSVSAQP